MSTPPLNAETSWITPVAVGAVTMTAAGAVIYGVSQRAGENSSSDKAQPKSSEKMIGDGINISRTSSQSTYADSCKTLCSRRQSSSLTKPEIIVMQAYTATNTGTAQSGLHSDTINGLLRKNIVSESFKENLQLLDSAISKSSTGKSMMTQRGLSIDHLPADIKEGDVFSDPAYLSSSMISEETRMSRRNFGTGQHFSKAANLIIFGKSGAVVKDIVGEFNPETIEGEKEVLYPRGTQFRVRLMHTYPLNDPSFKQKGCCHAPHILALEEEGMPALSQNEIIQKINEHPDISARIPLR